MAKAKNTKGSVKAAPTSESRENADTTATATTSREETPAKPTTDPRPSRSRKEQAKAETTRAQRRKEAAVQVGSPAWLVPTALTLLILGVLYMVVYYISSAQFPLPIGDWNLAVGVGLILLGGMLLTGWK